MNFFTKQKETHRLKEQTLHVRGKDGGRDKEFWMDRYTLLYLKQITNKGLLYSVGNSAQCYVAVLMEGEFGSKCICMAVSLCCLPETVTTLLIGYTPIQNKKRKNEHIKSFAQA